MATQIPGALDTLAWQYRMCMQLARDLKSEGGAATGVATCGVYRIANPDHVLLRTGYYWVYTES